MVDTTTAGKPRLYLQLPHYYKRCKTLNASVCWKLTDINCKQQCLIRSLRETEALQLPS